MPSSFQSYATASLDAVVDWHGEDVVITPTLPLTAGRREHLHDPDRAAVTVRAGFGTRAALRGRSTINEAEEQGRKPGMQTRNTHVFLRAADLPWPVASGFRVFRPATGEILTVMRPEHDGLGRLLLVCSA